MVGESNDETNFPCKLLVTDKQVSRLCKAFANESSANIKLSKTQLSKIVQLGGMDLFDFLVAPGVFLAKDIPKNVQKKMHGDRIMLTNNKIKNIVKVIRSLENR